MSAPPKIVVLDRYQTGESASPSHENILAGIPRTRVSNQYSDGRQEFFCGIWTSTAGKWRVRYTEHEFCVIIEGRLRIESVTGEKHELKAGDAFVARRIQGHLGSQRPPRSGTRSSTEKPTDQSVLRITVPSVSTGGRSASARPPRAAPWRWYRRLAPMTPRFEHGNIEARVPGLPCRASISTALIRLYLRISPRGKPRRMHGAFIAVSGAIVQPSWHKRLVANAAAQATGA